MRHIVNVRPLHKVCNSTVINLPSLQIMGVLQQEQAGQTCPSLLPEALPLCLVTR